MKSGWTPEKLKEFEVNLVKLFEGGKIKAPLHLCGGNEEELIAMFDSIKEEDYVLSTHRNHYHYLLKGGNPQALIDEILGKKGSMSGGQGRSMNTFAPEINFYSSAIVAGNCAIAAGIALGIKKKAGKKKKRPMVWCFVGDGAEDSGHFMEAARFGVARDLPLTFIVEDNDRSTDSTKADRWHNYPMFNCTNVMRYNYERTYPHVGIGKHVTF
jgi:TPP-dependent pyruvate/acetoin dehydrogenase alpha subunit